jgi:hypothetical protein
MDCKNILSYLKYYKCHTALLYILAYFLCYSPKHKEWVITLKFLIYTHRCNTTTKSKLFCHLIIGGQRQKNRSIKDFGANFNLGSVTLLSFYCLTTNLTKLFKLELIGTLRDYYLQKFNHFSKAWKTSQHFITMSRIEFNEIFIKAYQWYPTKGCFAMNHGKLKQFIDYDEIIQMETINVSVKFKSY